MMQDVEPGQVYRMRRQHPCGSWEWRVYRTGADIGIECLGCQRRVMLERRKFEARARALVPGAQPP
ncbi:MAG: DUF951 domain-containing protein [Dehalococcoidia bacterium]|nr:DUF951 domain-containing protein [Dehalococcoidia bacterium]